MARLDVLTVPAFNDNYLWLMHDGRQAVAVDPGDAAPILAALKTHHLSLAAILLTHHHADHIGGVAALAEIYGCPVYGPWQEEIPGVSHPLGEGDHVILPLEGNPRFDVLEVPGHTRGHIAYHCANPNAEAGWLFCGDTLFAAGCGRLFEGTPAQMAASLSRLATLPDATRVYCAHEYTLSNLKFALEVEPGNAALRQRALDAQALRDRGVPTVPSTIALEKATNPFLRADAPAIAARLAELGRLPATASPAEVFANLREWKNVYR